MRRVGHTYGVCSTGLLLVMAVAMMATTGCQVFAETQAVEACKAELWVALSSGTPIVRPFTEWRDITHLRTNSESLTPLHKQVGLVWTGEVLFQFDGKWSEQDTWGTYTASCLARKTTEELEAWISYIHRPGAHIWGLSVQEQAMVYAQGTAAAIERAPVVEATARAEVNATATWVADINRMFELVKIVDVGQVEYRYSEPVPSWRCEQRGSGEDELTDYIHHCTIANEDTRDHRVEIQVTWTEVTPGAGRGSEDYEVPRRYAWTARVSAGETESFSEAIPARPRGAWHCADFPREYAKDVSADIVTIDEISAP